MGHFSGKIETSGHAAQLPQVCKGSAVKAAPHVIWHIYSPCPCSEGDGVMDLPSSGDVALTMGQVPCEFRTDWPQVIFQGWLRQGA